MDCVVIRDVIAIVAQRRGEEWHKPYRAGPQFLKVVELLFKPWKITNAIPVAVVESADVDLVDDRVLVPKHIPVEWQTAPPGSRSVPPCKAGQQASLYDVTTENPALRPTPRSSSVNRYLRQPRIDGLPGEEGTFSLCSFWLVEPLTRAGLAFPEKLLVS